MATIVITSIVKHKGLQAELKQNKPFKTPADEAYVSLQRTADVLLRKFSHFIKPWGISPTQYNVLRILRGAGTEGLCCGEISERMITSDPDITRLLDRVEKLGWIERSRSTKDRRVVQARISRKGLELLKEIDGPLEEFNLKASSHVSEKKLRDLIMLLAEVRNIPEEK
jgi:MarR family transcriptional regulator, organic hydroperoxide resistance regulator